jgi:glycosyltransferase involved in cell wall biosynthesis
MKWIHFNSTSDIGSVGEQVFNHYVNISLGNHNDNKPLVTVFTPSYRTGDRIYRAYHSMRNQVYKNWEWVIVDDSGDGGKTFDMLCGLADNEPRMRVLQEQRNTGNIGKLKNTACRIGSGEYLIELDHDDELTPDAVLRVVDAYQGNPDVGFVYSDFAELFESGGPIIYGDNGKNWGWGYGSYRKENHWGVDYMVVNSPNINPKTIRHIISAPNHLRSWRRSVYEDIGGHNCNIAVADDYEIMVRTFLNTRMARVPHMCYLQYRNDTGNTHVSRNQEIQRLVRTFSQYYNNKIHERFLELGVDDFMWRGDGQEFWNLGITPNPEIEPHCTIIV